MGSVLTLIVVVVVIGLVIYAIATYNGLVRRRNEAEESYRQIDVQLKRRYDLIPNLLEGVKKYFRQEQQVLTEITQARSQAMQPQSPRQQAQSEARLSGAIGNLLMIIGRKALRPVSCPSQKGDEVLRARRCGMK